MTIHDHRELEAEGSISPIQAQISRLACDAEARKQRLLKEVHSYTAEIHRKRKELCDLQSARAEALAELGLYGE